MRQSIIILLVLVFLAASAYAATYKWEDDQGTVNFSEDPGSIPPAFRKKASIVGAEEPAPQQDATAPAEEQKVQKKKEQEAAKKETPANKKKVVYGSKEGDEWKKEFVNLTADLARVDEQLKLKKKMYGDPSKLTRSEYRSLEYEIKNLEFERGTLQGKLDTLTSDADKAGVPAEFRE